MPFLLNKNPQPILNSKVYKNILDADLIKKLNDLEKNNLLDFLMNPKVLLLLLVLGALAYWYFSVHTGNAHNIVTTPTIPLK